MLGRRKTYKILFVLVWNVALGMIAADLGGGLAAQVAASVPNDPTAQIEKGRTAVAQVCATCHTGILRMVQAQKQNQEQWKDTIFSMIGRGAMVLPDEIEPMSAFLAANSGRSGAANAQAAQAGGGGRQGSARLDQQGPQEEGQAILQRACQQCHDNATASKKLPSEDWTAVVAKMMTYGARLSPMDQQKLIAYLNGLAK